MPYIGYFQLMNYVDKWVVYDDVSFIKQGWINRNMILLNGEPHLFSIPLQKPSSFIEINQTEINRQMYHNWKLKFLKTLEQSYKKAPNFDRVYTLIKDLLEIQHQYISTLCVESILIIANYLKIKTQFVLTSTNYNNIHLNSVERVLDICKSENATSYVNLPGGKSLYQNKDFKNQGINLAFINSKSIEYNQFNNKFVSGLSIIDILMFNSPNETLDLLNRCKVEIVL